MCYNLSMDHSGNADRVEGRVSSGGFFEVDPNAKLANSSGNFAPSIPNLEPAQPEIAPIGDKEMLPSPEIQTGPKLSTPQSDGQTQQVQVSDDQSTTTASVSVVTATAPTSAADEDLIEKEWVEQAKKVVGTTRDNPHEQAKLVAELMRDYVKKRYGKEVGKAPDDI